MGVLAIIGAVVVGIGSTIVAIATVGQKKEDKAAAKELIDYELKTLGRRDGK